MGITFSSPQLADTQFPLGTGPFSTSYAFAPTDTNAFGISGTLTYSNTPHEVTPAVTVPGIGNNPGQIFTCEPIPAGTSTISTVSVLCPGLQNNYFSVPGNAEINFSGTSLLGLYQFSVTTLPTQTVVVNTEATTTSTGTTTPGFTDTVTEYLSTVSVSGIAYSSDYEVATVTVQGACSITSAPVITTPVASFSSLSVPPAIPIQSSGSGFFSTGSGTPTLSFGSDTPSFPSNSTVLFGSGTSMPTMALGTGAVQSPGTGLHPSSTGNSSNVSNPGTGIYPSTTGMQSAYPSGSGILPSTVGPKYPMASGSISAPLGTRTSYYPSGTGNTYPSQSGTAASPSRTGLSSGSSFSSMPYPSGNGVSSAPYPSGSGFFPVSYPSGSGVSSATYSSSTGRYSTPYPSGSGMFSSPFSSGSGASSTGYLSGNGSFPTSSFRSSGVFSTSHPSGSDLNSSSNPNGADTLSAPLISGSSGLPASHNGVHPPYPSGLGGSSGLQSTRPFSITYPFGVPSGGLSVTGGGSLSPTAVSSPTSRSDAPSARRTTTIKSTTYICSTPTICNLPTVTDNPTFDKRSPVIIEEHFGGPDYTLCDTCPHYTVFATTTSTIDTQTISVPGSTGIDTVTITTTVDATTTTINAISLLNDISAVTIVTDCVSNTAPTSTPASTGCSLLADPPASAACGATGLVYTSPYSSFPVEEVSAQACANVCLEDTACVSFGLGPDDDGEPDSVCQLYAYSLSDGGFYADDDPTVDSVFYDLNCYDCAPPARSLTPTTYTACTTTAVPNPDVPEDDTCNGQGYVSIQPYTSTPGFNTQECANACLQDSDCGSFAFFDGFDCLLYDQNVSDAGFHSFSETEYHYDRDCYLCGPPAPTTTPASEVAVLACAATPVASPPANDLCDVQGYPRYLPVISADEEISVQVCADQCLNNPACLSFSYDFLSYCTLYSQNLESRAFLHENSGEDILFYDRTCYACVPLPAPAVSITAEVPLPTDD